MFTKFHNQQKGFTLIELMIVVCIICILAALAIPRFMKASEESQQKQQKQQVKNTLQLIYSMEKFHRDAHGSYGDDGVIAVAGDSLQIGFKIPEDAIYKYEIFILRDNFNIVATANIDDDPIIDTWVIDHTGRVEHTINDLTG